MRKDYEAGYRRVERFLREYTDTEDSKRIAAMYVTDASYCGILLDNLEEEAFTVKYILVLYKESISFK